MEEELLQFCKSVKRQIKEEKYSECEENILGEMIQYPHSAIPHNLMGILLEAKHKHILAMKHFRAAYALEPGYQPASYNLEQYGRNHNVKKAVYEQKDLERRKMI